MVITGSNIYSAKKCHRLLYVDVTTFYGPAPTVPVISLTANPASITPGQSSTISWSATNSTNCRAVAPSGWTTSNATSGFQNVSPVVTTTYTLSCIGAGGTVSQSVDTTVSSVGSSLAAKVSGAYWPNWTTSPALRNVSTIDNLIYAAFAYGDGSQGGTVIWKPNDGSGVSQSTFISDLQYDHSRGQKVLLSIGGSNDLGVHLTNATQVTQMVNSINQIVSMYGFDGIDWDLENLSNVNAASLVAASNQLKQTWGPNFIISMAAVPSATLYKQAAQQLGANLDLFAMQFYGYSTTDSERISGIVSRINEMANTYGVSASKLVIGGCDYDSVNPSYVSSPASTSRRMTS